MTGEDGKTSAIEKFDKTDFRYWKMQIEDYLLGKNYIYLFWGRNLIRWKMQNLLFLICRCWELFD
jgi:hypothetical protein